MEYLILFYFLKTLLNQ